MKTGKSGKIAYVLMAISIIPLLFFGIVILFLATELFTRSMYQEIEGEMSGAAENAAYMIDLAYPGDYTLVGDKALELHKGDHNLTTAYALVDNIKENSGFEVTLFYQDTRILTTICDRNGKRIIGSSASEIVLGDVLQNGSPHFYTNTRIYGEEYFSYYTPLHNSDGSVVGMLFIGKPCTQVNQSVRNACYPLVLAVIMVALLIACAIYLYTRKFDVVLQQIRSFLSSVATGDLTAELDGTVLRRNDEFGDIGRSAAHMQQSLRRTIEQDALTGIYNRRSGDRRLHQIIEKSASTETPFCVSIGDIDFFKSVNDTYGHACGDEVLKGVAAILREHMSSLGFVARWGGEEFLLVFDRMTLEQAEASLNALLDKIRQATFTCEGQNIQVTMTFGVSSGEGLDHTAMLKSADTKLYVGKTVGRNQVCS